MISSFWAACLSTTVTTAFLIIAGIFSEVVREIAEVFVCLVMLSPDDESLWEE